MSNNVKEESVADLSNDETANGVSESREFVDKKGKFMSKKSAVNIEKTKEIISILDGLTVFDVKNIIQSLQNHLDQSTVVSLSKYELNIEPIFKSYKILGN